MGPGALGKAGKAFRYWERRQETVAHNLANASTPGFKGERVFATLLEGVGVTPTSQTDFRGGALEATGRPLDLALDGDGFLVLGTPQGERLVRGGSFQLDVSRRLVDAHGNTLLGDSGPIVLPEGDFEITPAGVVKVEDVPVSMLRIVRPREGATLRREAGVRFQSDSPSPRVEEGEVKVHQGHLEESNVNPVSAMVEMIEIQRAYSAIQRSVLVMDGVLGTISNEIGKVK
jgi:flagellar basal-body rod protein FlgF